MAQQQPATHAIIKNDIYKDAAVIPKKSVTRKTGCNLFL